LAGEGDEVGGGGGGAEEMGDLAAVVFAMEGEVGEEINDGGVVDGALAVAVADGLVKVCFGEGGEEVLVAGPVGGDEGGAAFEGEVGPEVLGPGVLLGDALEVEALGGEDVGEDVEGLGVGGWMGFEDGEEAKVGPVGVFAEAVEVGVHGEGFLGVLLGWRVLKGLKVAYRRWWMW
jgi:hypothetical protein